MPPSSAFVDRETGQLDTDRVVTEAILIAKLIALFGVLAYVPLVIVRIVPVLFASRVAHLASQFILAVGTGVVLLYVISRSIQLANA